MTVRTFFLVAFIISATLSVPCCGQQGGRLADSLLALLKRPDDSIKVDILNEYVVQVREGDNATALDWAKRSREMALALAYRKGLAGALANIGWILYRQGDFPSALENTTQSLSISEALNDYGEMSSGYNNLASIYVEQKEYPKALQTFKKALLWGRKANNQFSINRSYNNVAYVFFLTKALDSAKYYAEASISATPGYATGFAWRTLGDIYVEENNRSLAETNYLKSIAIADSNKNFSLKVSTSHRLGKLYLTHGQTEKAVSILKENEQTCRKFRFSNELANTYKVLASAFRQKSDFGNAASYYEKYISLNDSLYNELRSKQIALLENRYNAAKIDLLTKEGEIKDKEIKSQRLKSFLYIGGLVLFVAFAFLLNRNNQRIKLANEQLELKNSEISERGVELKAQTEELARLNATKDKLFSIISHDLRGPLNSLSGLLHISEQGFISETEFKGHIAELTKNTNRTIELLNNLLHWSGAQLRRSDPRPGEINLRNLVDSVVLLYEKQAREKNIKVANQFSPCTAWADPDMISLVFRNLVSNALKFSKPGGAIAIGYNLEDHQVQCFVKDNGIGISKTMLIELFSGAMVSTQGTANEGGTGLGLQLCIDFVIKNGGRLWAESEEGSGSTFSFTLPLKA